MKSLSILRCAVATLLLMAAGTVAAATHVQSPASDESSEVRIMAQQMPSFKGGTVAAYQKWVSFKARSEARAKGVKGTCSANVLFVVDTQGQVTNIEVKSASSQEFADAVTQVMERSPKWRAGRQDGKPVKVRLLITVTAEI